MGVESGSQKILDAMEKNLKVEIVPKVRERLARAGIRACYFLQFGYPGEGWTEIQQTIDLVRRTRPDDIGVSVSYPLPNTRFYERVRHQLGTKRNWHDSDDLCATFTAAYQNGFYLALRDALHYEVNGWRGGAQGLSGASEQLWRRVAELEPISRNAQPTDLQSHVQSTPGFSGLIPAQSLSAIAGEV
jgi:hypothetical protein